MEKKAVFVATVCAIIAVGAFFQFIVFNIGSERIISIQEVWHKYWGDSNTTFIVQGNLSMANSYYIYPYNFLLHSLGQPYLGEPNSIGVLWNGTLSQENETVTIHGIVRYGVDYLLDNHTAISPPLPYIVAQKVDFSTTLTASS